VDILTMAVFGGTSNLIGPMIGSTILSLLPEVLRHFKDHRLAINGLILILVVLYLPKGASVVGQGIRASWAATLRMKVK
jgi:branched-chain amino acid transport system permease protein